MEFVTALLSILAIHLMASISPGPDFVVVSQKTLFQGRKAGILCGAGVCVGLLFHMSYSLAGLATILAHSKLFTHVIGILGGSYLIYLGYKSIKGSFSKQKNIEDDTTSISSTSSAFLSGLIVNIMNPKAAMYFISIFSIIITPSMNTEQLVLIVVSIMAVQMIWYLTFIYLITTPLFKGKFNNNVYLIDRILGSVMSVMGFYMISSYTFY
ncbi:LysE family translocator [Vibrio gazogenes]|uniref:Threonine transporter RhtB n=1 Tax=Vibrio gazogenes TaxID=687 RepID=A0A1Z2SF45_VIBGA|nr:LysE family translocator [Vibrio gazogenes]ASA55804.1 threonine transporter RhtB [Vibrio gazogenes]